jgi:hypothetical protein
VNDTPASFHDLERQAKELGFDEVTLILSQSKAPNKFVVRSSINRHARMARVIEAVEHSIIEKMIRNLGADAPFARYLDRRRARAGRCPRSGGEGIG